MMQYGHFKRQRGIANSRSHEVLYLCYKHRAPKNLAKTRMYVDSGSAVWNQVVRNVPILSHKNHALVTREVREESLQSMIGVDVAEVEAKEDEAATAKPIDEDEAEKAGPADAATEKAVVTAAIRKRRLYRQLTGSEVPWFPHDNDIELLKELCHEAGKPRWVYFGTPAGGAGIHGCIEMGCSVLALCFDDHHKKNLQPFLVQRAVEAMIGKDTMVFRNDDLEARAKELKLAKDDTKEDEKEDKKKKEDGKKEDGKKEDEKEDKKKEKKKEKKEDKKKEDKKKRKQASSDSASDSSSPTTEESSPKKKKRNKKA